MALWRIQRRFSRCTIINLISLECFNAGIVAHISNYAGIVAHISNYGGIVAHISNYAGIVAHLANEIRPQSMYSREYLRIDKAL